MRKRPRVITAKRRNQSLLKHLDLIVSYFGNFIFSADSKSLRFLSEFISELLGEDVFLHTNLYRELHIAGTRDDASWRHLDPVNLRLGEAAESSIHPDSTRPPLGLVVGPPFHLDGPHAAGQLRKVLGLETVCEQPALVDSLAGEQNLRVPNHVVLRHVQDDAVLFQASPGVIELVEPLIVLSDQLVQGVNIVVVCLSGRPNLLEPGGD